MHNIIKVIDFTTDDRMSKKPDLPSSRGIALGSFDGVHRGHQKILDELKLSCSQLNLIPSALTFSELPVQHFAKENKLKNLLITDLSERIELLRHFGAEQVIVLDFKSLVNIEASDYLNCILRDKLNAKFLCFGKDHKFGKDGKGNIELLRLWSEQNLITLKVIEDEKIISKDSQEERKLSSSYIRELLRESLIKEANEALGHNFSVSGTVIKGAGLGRGMGFPTVNIEYPTEKIKIKSGVYAALTNGFLSAINFGIAPTVKNSEIPILESHIIQRPDEFSPFDLKEGSRIKIEFLSFVREEKKFSSIEELKNNIKHDCEFIVNYYSLNSL